MEEDNKTVTMPLSEYRRMEELVYQKEMSEEEVKELIAKKENEVKREMRDKYEDEIIGMNDYQINRFISDWDGRTIKDAINNLGIYRYQEGIRECDKLRLRIKELEDSNEGLRKHIESLNEQNRILRTKKWYQFWK